MARGFRAYREADPEEYTLVMENQIKSIPITMNVTNTKKLIEFLKEIITDCWDGKETELFLPRIS